MSHERNGVVNNEQLIRQLGGGGSPALKVVSGRSNQAEPIPAAWFATTCPAQRETTYSYCPCQAKYFINQVMMKIFGKVFLTG
jgi:hypothetical protein